MPKNNIMWNLMMLRVVNAIEVFTITHPLSNQDKEEYILACQLIKEYKWAMSHGPYRFIKFFKGVTP